MTQLSYCLHLRIYEVGNLLALLRATRVQLWYFCLQSVLFVFCFLQNLEIKTDSAKALAESLDKAESPDFPYLNTLLRILTTRCMMQAVYFCSGMDSDFHHYGLASPIYTHFTSPIRRYFLSFYRIVRGQKK